MDTRESGKLLGLAILKDRYSGYHRMQELKAWGFTLHAFNYRLGRLKKSGKAIWIMKKRPAFRFYTEDRANLCRAGIERRSFKIPAIFALLGYQRLPPPPYPPPPPRLGPRPPSGFGRASLTVSARPCTSLPLQPAIAACAS